MTEAQLKAEGWQRLKGGPPVDRIATEVIRFGDSWWWREIKPDEQKAQQGKG